MSDDLREIQEEYDRLRMNAVRYFIDHPDSNIVAVPIYMRSSDPTVDGTIQTLRFTRDELEHDIRAYQSPQQPVAPMLYVSSNSASVTGFESGTIRPSIWERMEEIMTGVPTRRSGTNSINHQMLADSKRRHELKG